mgnify:CR=1 FL=1
MSDRTAPTEHAVLPAIAARWSPRSYLPDPVGEAQLRQVLEAGRWAASAYNEQPWTYLIARRDADAAGHERILSCLVEFNQGWAKAAPVLMIACVRKNNGKGQPNRWAEYDCGQASSAMAIQAAALGLQLHQMAGFDAARTRATLGLPDDVEPIAAIALGTPGPAAALPEGLAARETAPRMRKPAAEIFMGAGWGASL